MSTPLSNACRQPLGSEHAKTRYQRRISLGVVVGLSAGISLTSIARAQALRYAVTPVNFGTASSVARCLNARGDVVGTYQVNGNVRRVYVYRAGIFSTPPLLLAQNFFIIGSPKINNANQIAFTGVPIDTQPPPSAQAYLLTGDLLTVIPPINGIFSEATALNNAGHVAGRSDVSPSAIYAYLYAAGVTIDLGQIHPPFGNRFAATGINDSDVVVGTGDNAAGGQSGFLWNGVMNDLGQFRPNDVNNDGLLCGTVLIAGSPRAATRDGQGIVQVIPGTGVADSNASAINIRATTVGFARSEPGTAFAFVYNPASPPARNLNHLLTRADRAKGFEFAAAYAVNDAGQILVSDGYSPFLLTPVDDCPADFNLDGGVDGEDVSDFFSAWVRAEPLAEINGDGGIDGADIEPFFNAWVNAGCRS